MLEVTEARGSCISYELALLSLLGSSPSGVDTSAGGSANGSGTETGRIALVRGGVTKREVLDGPSSVETWSAKGFCACSAKAEAATGGSFQPPVLRKGGDTGREYNLECGIASVSCISGVRVMLKVGREARRKCRRRRYHRPTRIRMRTTAAAVDAAIAAIGTELLIRDQ